MKRKDKLENGLGRLFSSSKKEDASSSLAADPGSTEAIPENPPVEPATETIVPEQADLTIVQPEPMPTPVVVTNAEPPADPILPAKESPVIPSPVSPVPLPAPDNKIDTGTDQHPTPSAQTKLTYENDEHLTLFTLAGQVYGVSIASVESIIKMQPITIVPNTNSCIDGVTNLRGKVIPVVNLHTRMNIGERTITDDSRIVVVHFKDVLAGLLVDEVNAVQVIKAEQIEHPSGMVLSSVSAAYIQGIAKLDNQLVILLNLEEVLNFHNN